MRILPFKRRTVSRFRHKYKLPKWAMMLFRQAHHEAVLARPVDQVHFLESWKVLEIMFAFIRSILAFGMLCAVATAPVAASAQSASDAPAPKAKPNPYGSPLDTFLSTRLWTDVPQARDFVKESRPDPKSLEYAPLTGKDPARPTPRDPAGVAALQAELESSGVANEARAKGLRDPAKPAPARHARKSPAKRAPVAAAN